MDQQADPSAAKRLLDLPESCLHHIVSFMDSRTRLQFFRTSKGSQDEPGCAVLVLRASKLTLSYTHYPNDNPSPALASLIHWAAQISADMQLDITRRMWSYPLLDVLHSLLLYPDARTIPTGRVLGRPAAYPGVTSLQLWSYRCSSLIPELVADAFPSLKSLTVWWRPDPSQPLGPVLQGGLPHLQHVVVGMSPVLSVQSVSPAAVTHVAQQLSHMPSLTSADVQFEAFQAVFAAVSASVLAKLKELTLDTHGPPTAQDKATLKACSQLESLTLDGHQAGDWVKALNLHAPSIRTLQASINMADRHLSSLLALPNLTSLTVEGLRRLSDDYSSAPCSWRHFKCCFECTSHITRLSLHALNSPIECTEFCLYLSDPAADLAAIRAAKPHLLRCGGIKMAGDCAEIGISGGSNFTKEQVAEVLAEWAPCFPVPDFIGCYSQSRPIIEDAATQLWPEVQFACWESESEEYSDDVALDEEGSDEGLFEEGLLEEGSDDVASDEEGSDE